LQGKSRAKKTFKTLKEPLASNTGSNAPQQVSSSSAHTKLFCSSSFQNFSNKQNMSTTREHKQKPPVIPECLTIQKQKRTNNNSSNGITGAIRDDTRGGEKKRESERAQAVRELREGRRRPLVGPTEALNWWNGRPLGGPTEALNWWSGRPLLSRFEGPGPWSVRRAANKNEKNGGR
jgi:hypothetical protein